MYYISRKAAWRRTKVIMPTFIISGAIIAAPVMQEVIRQLKSLYKYLAPYCGTGATLKFLLAMISVCVLWLLFLFDLYSKDLRRSIRELEMTEVIRSKPKDNCSGLLYSRAEKSPKVNDEPEKK